ncbi:hypothetical protein EDB92DRAFT_1952439 [Lactarius akahatsu]|uniref:Uncharacterized protein n=1 Tax=Lactarius akahatsu TaxID=416441 RepID=A0AAD4Q3W3_9AGAM|nr:hypothetical protein EDB92DRAFT_1952439 [Lactarius akahatsu]
MSTPALLQGLTFDLQSINDLAFDEDCETFLQLGLLAFLAAFIWFMNSKRSWQEIFELLNGSLSVLSEGERIRYFETLPSISSECAEGFLPNYS